VEEVVGILVPSAEFSSLLSLVELTAGGEGSAL
jgi:hypothetical protein